ncbi:multi-sensor hybrid histidine kinase [Calothrix sp. NIES-4101]|nr:multi-sensor hybrid histidine kinase [Calothrix sp. NIES-4101]
MYEQDNCDRHVAGNKLPPQYAALLECENICQILLDNSPNYALMLFDQNLRYLAAEGQGLTVFGIEPQTIIGQTIWEVFPHQTCVLIEPLYRQALAGETKVVEVLGNHHFYQINTIPVKNERKEIFAGMAIVQNITERKKVEQSLRESEELNRSILENSPDCIKILDLDARLLSMNKPGLLLMEIDDFTPLIGKPWIDFWQEPARSLVLEAIETAKKGKVGRFRGFRHTAKGTPKWWDVMVSLVTDAEGKPKLLVSSSRDITAQKQSQEELEQNKEILWSVLENLPVGVWISDKNGKIVHTNRAGEEIWAGKKYVGTEDYGEYRGWWADTGELISPEEWAMRRAIQQGETSINEVIDIECFDGSHKTILNSAVPLRDSQGNINGGIAVNQDISEYRQMQAERQQMLARSQHYANQLRGLTKAALAINSALSIAEVIKVITEQARTIIGAHQCVTSTTTNENWEQSISFISLSDKYAAWRDYHENPNGSGIYRRVCETNRPMRMTQAEIEAHPQWQGFGSAREKHPPMRGWLAAPLVGRDSQNLGLIQLSDKDDGSDFSEEDESILVQIAQMGSIAIENTRLYEAEQKARSEAEQANRIKDEFLAVLSHELRSPLNPILGWSKILQTRKLNPESTAEALTIIERNAKLQGQLIEDLLDISRILQGKLTLNASPVELKSLILAAWETVRLAAEAKDIQITTVFAVDFCHVLGDAGRLQQVFWNLFTNAVKFTPNGGWVKVSLEQIYNNACITFTDNGKGIKKEFLPDVFEYFRQADSATTRKFGGLGLGLAIVQQITEMHGGKVSVESEGEDLGATFKVQLPLSQMTEKQENNITTEEMASDCQNLQDIQILVVDDDIDSRDFITFVLETEGAIITQATSAFDALEILSQFQPTIIISDIGMPEMDGYMLMRQIRTLPQEAGGNIPAVALTAYASEYDQKQAIAVGFQKHLSKPIEPNELIEVIVQVVKNT